MEKIKTQDAYLNQINKDSFTVIKYYTSWCPDCKNMDRFIGDIIDLHSDKQWFELNAEDLPEVAEENEVRGVPSLLVYKNGKKVGHLHSKFAKTPAQVTEYLESLENTSV